MTIFAGLWDVSLATPIGTMAVVLDISDQDGCIRGTAANADETVTSSIRSPRATD